VPARYAVKPISIIIISYSKLSFAIKTAASLGSFVLFVGSELHAPKENIMLIRSKKK